MEWSPKQQRALDSVSRWIENPGSQVFKLFGYAGTGKTTLAKHFAEQSPGRTLFAAFTGKAALVLQEKGCYNASTIHRLIYIPKDKSASRLHDMQSELLESKDLDRQRELRKLIEEENENLKRPVFSLNFESEIRDSKLVIIDEVSMVGRRMAEDLLSFRIPILVLGDTAQLPPVADGGYFTKGEPDIMLDEIHRQAAGSPVIRMATKVREGGDLSIGTEYHEDHEPSHVVNKGDLNIHALASFDQILVGRNATRKTVNRMLRKETLNRESHLPEEGDKLVCLRNNNDLGLMNGSLWNVVRCSEISDDAIGLTIEDPSWGSRIDTIAHRHHFEDREGDLDHWEKRERNEFDFGYALTVHKVQGSQWDKVVLIDESTCFRQDARKWLYTGITRASKSITVIR